MHSRLEIINLALANLGNLNFVQSEDEASPEADQARAHYDACRDSLLAEHPWSFAARRQVLARLAEEADGESLFLYPPDCVFIRRAYRPETPGQGLPFRVERTADNLRKAVRAPARDGLGLFYTTNAVPAPDYPAGFVQVLAWRLAAEIALSSRADPQLAQAMHGAAGFALGKARLREASETGPRRIGTFRWERARRGV